MKYGLFWNFILHAAAIMGYFLHLSYSYVTILLVGPL